MNSRRWIPYIVVDVIAAKGHILVGDFVAAFGADGQLLSVDIPSLQFSASIYDIREGLQ